MRVALPHHLRLDLRAMTGREIAALVIGIIITRVWIWLKKRTESDV